MSFQIERTARRLNSSGRYFCKMFSKDVNLETWLFIRPVRLLDEHIDVHINVTILPKENLISFVMPIFGDGSEGLVGENILRFDSLLHSLNSKIRGGYFTKYTYDDSYALVFMQNLPLNQMTPAWFESILGHFTDIMITCRPIIGNMINQLGLEFDRKAGLSDSGRKFLIDNSEKYRKLYE